MITLQHSALLALALYRKSGASCFDEAFNKQVPWALLPDGIRAYVGPRQPSHFEMTPDGTDGSWMVFPAPSTLKGLSKENAKDRINFYLAEGYPKCIIGEDTSIASFDEHNWGHEFHQALRTHMLQDVILDQTLREEMVNVKDRFDDKFVVRHNRTIVLDGAALREQIALFEHLGFLYLAGHVYEATNGAILLTKDWYDKHVYQALREAYPVDLAESTYGFMKKDLNVVNARVEAHQFDLTDSDKEKVIMADNLEEILDGMYSQAMYYTMREF